MSETTGVILIDHGSRQSVANRLLGEVAARLAAELALPVAEAHMTFAEPTLAQAMDRLVGQGCSAVVVCPYFLGVGTHATKDIPRMAAEAAADRPGIRVTVAAPLGIDDLLVRLAAKRIRPHLPTEPAS